MADQYYVFLNLNEIKVILYSESKVVEKLSRTNTQKELHANETMFWYP